jgi:diguanylate cyclase (GGDEF)-like protein/putative nucleotidyltransferase with HDIG domain
MGLDGLRKINATYGHAIGDKVIIDFGLIVTNALRCVDTVGRFYGDEFLAILPETPLSNSSTVCDRIQNAVKNFAFANGEAGVNATISIGLSCLSATLRSAGDLLSAARDALVGAKKRGAGSTCTVEEAKLIEEPARENKELIVSVQHQIGLLTEEARKLHYNGIYKLFNDITFYRKMLSHSEHVAFYSERLASKMDLSRDDVAIVRHGALLHDVGKLAIDERIVLKNGPLSSTEFAIVRQHPVFAAQMLSSSPFVKAEVNTILHHHEHYDGNGYPDHMQGTNIPLFSRIIALAESWDTMISPQVYREPLPLDQALSELKKGAGRQFDPELVALFTGLIEN